MAAPMQRQTASEKEKQPCGFPLSLPCSQRPASPLLAAGGRSRGSGRVWRCWRTARSLPYSTSPPAERPAYRRHALNLLTAQLAEVRTLGDADRSLVHQMMQSWLGHVEFASVRDPAEVERLPPEERDAWQKLWADTRDLRDRTAPTAGPPKPDR